jgi:hypothetical protein
MAPLSASLDGGLRRARLRRNYCAHRNLRQTEIENLGMAPLGDKNVRRLNVAVDDAFAMGGVESVGVLKSHAIQVLHRDKLLTLVVRDLVCGADWDGSKRKRPRLATEPFEDLRVFGDFIRQKFQRHKAAERGVLGLVDHAHPAPAQLLDNAVMRDGLPNHAIGPCYEACIGKSISH